MRTKTKTTMEQPLLLPRHDSTASSPPPRRMDYYQPFWMLTAVAAIVTGFLIPYQIAFEHQHFALEIILNGIFVSDIVIHSTMFQQSYWRSIRFPLDVIGVLPFQTILFGILSNPYHRWIPFVRLVRFVRLYRLKRLSDVLQYNGRISLLWSTLLRNLTVILFTTHLGACTMYLLAKWKHFGPDTWIGNVGAMDHPYIRSLWLSVVAFMTVGFGDYSAVNATEMIAMMTFMMINIIVASWFIGSITLLVVKGDEKTGEYRDALETLQQYNSIHEFETEFAEGLQRQLRLDFVHRDIADEQVLKNFPSAVRRKILRKLYLKSLEDTQLLHGIRPQFVDAFLSSCTVEIFSAGECIIERGSILSDLFLLVGGIAETSTTLSSHHGPTEQAKQFEEGCFMGEIAFFTESPQIDSVVCVTVCKTLTMSQASFKALAQDHPGSAGKILQNLLTIVQDAEAHLPSSLPALYAGSMHDVEQGYGSLRGTDQETFDGLSLQPNNTRQLRETSLTAIQDLVRMHMAKLLDDQTTRFCFAASRGDTSTISLMCDQGFDPNNSDYDKRTALMVAAMKGNTDVVTVLLRYKANPNLTDVHGTSALLEAVKNGHDGTMRTLRSHGASLCLPEHQSASILCQAVFDGDIVLLQRLLKAGIPVNASDYDKRTASHIAAAEGNVVALRVLGEHNADFELADRWQNTVYHEAERANATKLTEYLRDKQKT